MSIFRFRPEHHLRKNEDFDCVYQHKCSVADDWLIIYGRENDLSHSRLGLSVSKKNGNAVQRNRLRRLYREAFRLTRPEIPEALDLIFIPRQKEPPTLQTLQESLRTLIPKLVRRLKKKTSPSPSSTTKPNK